MTWRNFAACKSLPTGDFYPIPGAQQPGRGRAMAACRSCLVRDECLREALKAGERQGIWGEEDLSRRTKRIEALRQEVRGSA